jgi:peroxiredoxin
MHCLEHAVQVHQNISEFEALGTQVLIIGFQETQISRQWLERSGVSFSFLMDPDRKVYRAYGLGRSVWRSWHPRNLWSYFKRMLAGQGLPRITADPNQMGGDFIVDRTGVVRLAYFSHDPTDRPSVEQLLDLLRDL